ncbi:MAG: protein kinase [Planctomycetes bacterium]|nr:protein kinase [Planctomycetota bacterium]
MGGPNDIDVLTGKIAVERGLISEVDLGESLAECTSAVRLTNVLVARGRVARQDLLVIHREVSPILVRASTYSQIQNEDLSLADALVKRKLVDSDRVRTALQEQEDAAKNRPDAVPQLTYLLMRHGAVPFETLRPFLPMEPPIDLICSVCHIIYALPQSMAGGTWLCHNCDTRLRPRSTMGSTVHAAPEGMPMPEEVHIASADPKNHFGKFVLVRELGRGGMGAVHQAWDSSTHRWVAVKILLGRGGDEELGRFQREAQTAGRLKHPHIVSIYEVDCVGDRPYIAMEFVDGRPLGGQKIAVRRACEIVREIALAVDYAHEQGVIHRDLKPSNIMVDRYGRAYVMDFGLAKFLAARSAVTSEGTVVGTPSYMAPEQAKGQALKIDRQSDVYSLGAILYELLCGRAPFRGKNPVETLELVLKSDATPPSQLNASVSTDLENIVLKAIEKDRGRRYASAYAFAVDLKRYLDGESVSARKASTLRRLVQRASRHKLALSAVAGALLTVLAVMMLMARAVADWRAKAIQAVADADRALAENHLERALATYETAAKLDPQLDLSRKIEEARLRIAQAKSAEEARGRSIALLSEGQRRLHEALLVLYRAGADLTRMQADIEQAIERFDDAVELNPQCSEAYHARGRARRELGRFDGAERDQTAALEINANYGAAYRERARVRAETLLARRRLCLPPSGSETRELADRILADLRRAAELDGSSGPEEAFCQAAIELVSEKPQGAIKALTECINAGLFTEDHYLLRGEARQAAAHTAGSPQERKEQLDWALEDLSKAIEIRHNFVTAYLVRGSVLMDTRAPQEAHKDFAKAASLDSTSAAAQLTLGFYYHLQGQHDTAFEHYTKAANLDQSLPPTFSSPLYQACAHIKQAQICQERGKTGEALEHYEQARRIFPGSYEARLGRASIWIEQGHLDRALDEVNALISEAPQQVGSYVTRAKAKYLQKKFADCVADLERAFAMEPSLRQHYDAMHREAKLKAGY